MNRSSSTLKRWLTWSAVVILALFALYICLGIWAVPAIVQNQIQSTGTEMTGREVSVNDVEFNPLTLELRLLGLSVEGQEFEKLLQADRLVANAELTSVLPGRIELKLLQMEGIELAVSKGPDGQFNFQDILDRLETTGQDEEKKEGELKARIQQLVGNDIEILYVDRSLPQPYQETLTIEQLRGEDIATWNPNEDDENAAAPQEEGASQTNLVWEVQLQGSTSSGASFSALAGATSVEPWRFYAHTSVDGFPIGSIQPYVSQTAALQVAGSVGLEASASVDFGASQGMEADVNGSLQVTDLSARDDQVDYVVAEAFRVQHFEATLPEQSVRVEGAYLVSPVFGVTLNEQRAPVLPEFAQTQTQSAQSEEQSEGEDQGQDASTSLSFVVRDSGIKSGAVQFRDRSLEEPFETRISDINFDLSRLEGSMAGEELSLSSTASLAASLLNGDVTASAALDSLDQPVSFESEWNGLTLATLQPYVRAYAMAAIESGSASGSARGTIGMDGTISVEGGSEVSSLELRNLAEEREFAAIERIAVQQAAFSNGSGLSLDALVIERPVFNLLIDQQGLTLMRMIPESESSSDSTNETPPESSSTSSSSSPDSASPLPFPVTVQQMTVSEGAVGITDTSLVSLYKTRVSGIDVSVAHFVSPGDTRADFSAQARINEAGHWDSEGTIAPLDPAEYMDLSFTLEGFNLASTSPYWETYLARELESGLLRLVGRYQTRNGNLDGSNDFYIAQFDLGERVESDRAMLENIPLGLVIGLLKGPDGVIKYEGLDISGDLTSPEVDPWGLVGKAFSGLATQAASAPFSFLSRMVGGRDDVNAIAFDTGSVALDSTASEKASEVGRMLSQRPALILEVLPVTNEEAEREILRRQVLAYRLMNPNSQPQTLEDLQQAYDQEAFRAAVERAYIRMTQGPEVAAAETGSEQAASSTQEVDEAVDEDGGERRGVFKRLSRFLGFGRGESDSESEDSDQQDIAGTDADEGEEGETTEEIQLPEHSEMVDALLADTGDLNVREEWIQSIGQVRAEAVKQSIVDAGGLEASRITVGESEAESDGIESGVTLELENTDV